MLNTKDFSDINAGGPLTKPKKSRPIVNIRDNTIRCLTSEEVTPTEIIYFKVPKKVQWAYVVVNEKALYNGNVSVDFELHQSEETELVYKILKFAGINLKAPEMAQLASALEDSQVQKEKI